MTSTSSKAPPTDRSSPLIISRRLALSLLMITGIILVAFLYRSALSALILGLILAYLLIPAAKFLVDRLALNHKASTWIVYLFFLGTVITLIRYSAPILTSQINILAHDMTLISNELINAQPVIENILNISIPMEDIIAELETEANRVLEPNRLFMIIRSATANSVWILVTLMTCFYTLRDHKALVSWLHQITPDTFHDSLKIILTEINQVWKTYLRGQLWLMLIIGVLSGVGGMAVGLRNALVIGLLAGLLEMIPSLGPTLSTIIAGATAWTQGSTYLDISNFWFAVLVCGIFITIQALENTILIPRIMGRRMGLHPAVVFIAIISTLSLFGLIAGLVIVPVISSLVIIIQYTYRQLD